MANDLKITISGIPPYDGVYEIDSNGLTNRNYYDIKRLSGYTAVNVWDAMFQEGDIVALMAIGYVAVASSGRFPKIIEQPFWAARVGDIVIDAIETGTDDPPTTTPEAGTPS